MILSELRFYEKPVTTFNRANNAETANIARTVSASMKTINNISKIKDIMGLENLPVDLQEVASCNSAPRLLYPQLADSLSTPLTQKWVSTTDSEK